MAPLEDSIRATLADPALARGLLAGVLPRVDASAAAGHLAEIAALPLPDSALGAVVEALPRMGDVAWTLLQLKRWLRARVDEGAPVDAPLVSVVAPVMSHSPWLARLLQRSPELAVGLAADRSLTSERSAEDYLHAAHAVVSAGGTLTDAERGLRAVRNREILRIVAREVAGEDIRETMRELSHLAAALVEAALWRAHREVGARFGTPRPADAPERPCRSVVMGMGKLGGGELNLSSDIDLIYLYETDEGGTDGVLPPGVPAAPGVAPRAVSLHEYHVRLFELTSALLSKQTGDGFCFRVDLGLRPEGIQGPVCNSVAAAEAYYEQWGHAWERVAWLRARPVAGDLALGAAFLEAVRPFVYRRSLDPGAIDEIGRMKRQIDQRASRAARAGERGYDLKLGEGGIREIEFFVNALQLVWGGRAPHVRDQSTLRALDRLLFAGLIRAEEHEALRDAYVLYRRAEHRVQMREDRQAYSLPAEAEGVDAIARGMGIVGRGQTAGEALLARIERHAERVSAIFRGLLESHGAAPESDDGALDAGIEAALDERVPEAARTEALAGLGFAPPDRALDVLSSLQRVPASPFHVRHVSRQGELVRALMRDVARCPAPLEALVHVRELVRTLSDGSGIYDLLRDRPAVRRMLITLFAASPFLSRAVIRRPSLLDTLVFQGSGPACKRRGEMDTDLQRLLATTTDLGHALNLSRRFHTEELVRVGLLDIAGGLGVEEVGRQLSDLADTLVEAVLRLTREALVASHGPMEGHIAVFGLGRLGAQEMGYGSDLDILFVYDGSARHTGEADAHAWFTRLAQRLITNVSCMLQEGRLYEVDTRLRPSGSRGPLVSSFEAFRAWHEDGDSAVWERQALLKCRLVAGDRALETPVGALVDRVVYRPVTVADLVPEMRRVRARVETEVAREGGGAYNLKLGRGGIMDIEHVVQLLQLVHGASRPELRVGSIYAALRAVRLSRILPVATVTSLLEAYSFLRRLENRIRVVNDRPIDALDTTSEDVVRVARRMGYGDLPGEPAAQQLLAHYQRHTETVRSIYDSLLSEGGHGRQD